MMRTALIFILTLFMPTAHLAASAQKGFAREKIQTIPSEDLEVLDDFFRDLLFFHPFGYTLFGDKPISFECYDFENLKKPDVFATSCRGYKTWEKYAHLFPNDHYIFLFYEDTIDEIYELTVINKKAFLEIVNKHMEKFAKVFGPEITPENLLKLIIQKGSIWNTPLKEWDDLVGIMLGFGKNNAEIVQKGAEIENRKPSLKKRRTDPSPGYNSTVEELKAIHSRLKSFSNEGRITLNYMRLPSFAAEPGHPETIQLKKKYTDQRKRITKHFYRKNVLELTFEQLCNPTTQDF